jgi:hypothetical protein
MLYRATELIQHSAYSVGKPRWIVSTSNDNWYGSALFLTYPGGGGGGSLTVLKVPKRENFLLAFFVLSEPIRVGDLGTKQKTNFSI